MNQTVIASALLALAAALSPLSCAQAAPPATPPAAAQSKTTAVPLNLTTNGRALLPIVLSPQAGDGEKAAAKTLADYLQRISGAPFTVETSEKALTPNTSGLVLATAAHLSPAPPQLKPADPTATEDYILRTHATGMLVAGTTDLGLTHAVWDILYRLGYRQFFPGKTWEVIPKETNLSLALDTFQHPDYYSRRIWYGGGVLGENRESTDEWYARNRMATGVSVSTGHAYGGIITRNKAEFEKHPEYLTRPGGDKFCVTNPGLQELVIRDSLALLAAMPARQSVSLEPSDGGGWESGTCGDGAVYPNVTDRVVFLANIVADAIAKKYPDKFVGFYAYNEHSPPPTIKLHPNVIPSIATSFIRGGNSIDSLLKGWKEKASQIGIREYYSVFTWDHDMPGVARGSNLNYLRDTITKFNAQNAHYLSAESSDNWAPNGLGYYIASRLMWDTDEGTQIEALKNDFLTRAFGPAREPMAEFYRLIDGSNRPLLSSDLLGRMWRQLDAGLKLTNDPAITERIQQLALWVHYVELYSDYTQSSGEKHQAAAEAVMRYAWRIRTTHMIHSRGLYRDMPGRDKTIKLPADAGYRVPEPKNPWKSSEPYSTAEIQTFIADGVKNNEILSFTPVGFSDDLVPAGPLKLKTPRPGGFETIRGKQDFYTWIEKPPATIALTMKTGLIYTDRGEAKATLFPAAETAGESIATSGVKPDKEPHDVELKTSFPGLHRINITDGAAATEITWKAGTPMTVESSLNQPNHFAGGRWTMHFYVPKGTKLIGGYRAGRGTILNPEGKTALSLVAADSPSYWSIPVGPGQDGKLWTVYSFAGQVLLMTTPPYLARSAEELLLPREVVEADAAK